jgi:DNA-binding transcriptional MerR regulator
MAEEYTLEDLERLSGLPIRTLRFYIQEGLLPGPDTRGKFTRYSGKHLAAIEFIQRLKNMRVPLQQIRHLLDNMGTEELTDVMRSPFYASPDLNYNLMSGEVPGISYDGNVNPMSDSLTQNKNQGRPSIRDNAPQVYSSAAPVLSPQSKSQPIQKTGRQVEETWQRIRLADGLELQVRKPLDRHTSRLVDELRKIARMFFEDSQNKNEKGSEEDY